MDASSKSLNDQFVAPIRFGPDVERPVVDEAATITALIATMRYVAGRTFADGDHAIRLVHAKSHGILEGCLEVDEGLPGELAQGLFAKPGDYPLVMRFSTIPGDILDDSVCVPRGLAMKVIGVEGERLDGSEGDVAQDFLLIDGPAFGVAFSESISLGREASGENHRQASMAQKTSVGGYAAVAADNRRDHRPGESDCRNLRIPRDGERGFQGMVSAHSTGS